MPHYTPNDRKRRLPFAPRHRPGRALDVGGAGVALLVAFLLTASTTSALAHRAGGGKPPNILFVIMDDVGIDQMETFGYGGGDPPSTPSIDTLADEGLRFRNVWSTPACSSSRALMMDARFSLRTNVVNAIGQNDLANSMVSPFEVTVPKLMAMRGYDSALIGKNHMTLQSNDPAGLAGPHAMGYDYAIYWSDETGDPPSIDTRAGGVAPEDTWKCGFVAGEDDGGANSGACYMADDTCTPMSSSGPVPPGRTCRDQGGIFDPDKSCEAPPPSYVDFTRFNGHFVGPVVINYPDGSIEKLSTSDSRARQFRGQFVVDETVKWINSRPKKRPWIATASFSLAHTPMMQPPPSELHSVEGEETILDCTDPEDQRTLMNLMVEAMDTEIGRLLVEIGIARRNPDGSLRYDPRRSNTVVVVVGDNGTLGNLVKPPFDPDRAKASVYQTGVWVPLVVAGRPVVDPGRSVPHMVNIADLFQLFGELAGIDVHAAVPRPIDAVSMLPYLRDPEQESLRDYNVAEIRPNLQAGGSTNPPCVIGNTCVTLPPTKDVCDDNSGTWWGPSPDAGAEEVEDCCGVNQVLTGRSDDAVMIDPDSIAIRDDQYKLVQNTVTDWDPDQAICVTTVTPEFYEINENAPIPKLDGQDADLLKLGDLTSDEREHLEDLSSQLAGLLAPDADCPGDGNVDFRVDEEDLFWWDFYANSGDNPGGSSVYDFDDPLDGSTDASDQQIINDHLGSDCPVTVMGQGDPLVDGAAVQAAVNEGVARENGRVILEGNFDFGDCPDCVTVGGPVLIEGTGNPVGPNPPDPQLVTSIDSSASAPIVVQDESEGKGNIAIERLWLRTSHTVGIDITKLRGELSMFDNRITGISSAEESRFAVRGAGVDPRGSNLQGHVRAIGNYIDTDDPSTPFLEGDDNGFAFTRCRFDSIEIRDNWIETRGEAIDIAGCTKRRSVIVLAGNDIRTNAAISDLAPLTELVGIPGGPTGHPAAIKVMGNKAAKVLIVENDIALTGSETAICMLAGLSDRRTRAWIWKNRCSVSGQFGGLLAGWAGSPGSVPPSFLSNSVVAGNVFEGFGKYGIVFADFLYLPDPSADEVNRGRNNLFLGNDLGGYEASEAALYFGPRTRRNLFIGDPNGSVIDEGKGNVVLP